VDKSNILIKDVYNAKQNISSLVDHSPLRRSLNLSKLTGASVFLKLENLQPTGSFKIRGVTNKLFSLIKGESEGVITVSSGNHGQALSFVANRFEIPAVVYVSERTPKNKIDKIRRFGADVKVTGDTYEKAESRARAFKRKHGLTWVDPFDDPMVIAGQGTIGLELSEDNADIDTVVVPVGGGGLISGIGMVMKHLNPRIKVIGVQMERDPAMYHSLEAGRIVELDEYKETLADGLAGALPPEIQYAFEMCQEFVDDMVLVSEKEIGKAIYFALNDHRLVVEGAGAVGIAALLTNAIEDLGDKVVAVVSGSNIDISLLQKITQKYQEKSKE